jgi:hypothetical protein
MRTLILPACLAILLLAPLAAAGSPSHPEVTVTDPQGDAGIDSLDFLSIWIDPADTQNLTFHVTLAGAPPQPPAGTDHCAAGNCVFASLTYVLGFRVLDPNGVPTPLFPDYSRSYVAFRAGATGGSVASPMGYIDTKGALTVDGTSAKVSLEGNGFALRLPRDSVFVNLPKGPYPGAYGVDELNAYSQPEFCFPQQQVPTQQPLSCAPISKPQQTSGTPPAELAQHWDVAPDSGFGLPFTFPVAPPPAPVTQTSTTTPPPPAPQQTPSPSPTTSPTQPPPQPQPSPQPVGSPTPSPTPSPSPTPTAATHTTESAKASPALGLPLVLATVAGLLAVRRRLSA